MKQTRLTWYIMSTLPVFLAAKMHHDNRSEEIHIRYLAVVISSCNPNKKKRSITKAARWQIYLGTR